MSLAFALEKQVAVAAVRRACGLTASVFNRLVKNETLTKGDKSPVTVGDYGAQAVISTILHRAFPQDPIVGEEDSSSLRADTESALEMRDRIVSLANETLTAELGIGENSEWGIGPGQEQTATELLDAIDRGNFEGSSSGRMWTIDPIDGTKGFLRGGQYAVCVALIVDAVVQVGVIGCPNLPLDLSEPDGQKGSIFSAVLGQGTEQSTLTGANPTPIARGSVATPTSSLAFLESVEESHSDHGTNAKVAALLGMTKPPIRMDSQAKYGCLARGEGGIYLRIPTDRAYQNQIWDHAPGSLLVEEAGGSVTDSEGDRLNFGLGRTLRDNFGVVGTLDKRVHVDVLKALQQVLREEKTSAKA